MLSWLLTLFMLWLHASACFRKGERLDWMYGGGMLAKQEAEKRKEDMLLGHTEVKVENDKAAQENVSQVRHLRTGGAWKSAF